MNMIRTLPSFSQRLDSLTPHPTTTHFINVAQTTRSTPSPSTYPTKLVTGQQSPITDYTAVTPSSCTSIIHILSHIHLDSFLHHRSHKLQVVTFKQFCFLLSSSRLWVEFLSNSLKPLSCSQQLPRNKQI